MEVDWPTITRRLEIEGRSVGFIDTGGDGPPLVFIHGLGGVWQNWLLNLPVFMRTHRCIAVDLPGFGLSEELEEASIPGFARVVDKLCAELGIDEPTVIGNSMGGFVGAELAVRFPTRVSKLVLVAAAGLSTEYLSNQPLLAGARAFMMLTARTGLRGNGMVRRPRSRRLALQVVVRYPEKLSVALATELVQGANAPGFVDSFEALLTYSYRDKLERIEVPTMIV
jgi:pimeloyl-ACP methyl ester carboxylesterase